MHEAAQVRDEVAWIAAAVVSAHGVVLPGDEIAEREVDHDVGNDDQEQFRYPRAWRQCQPIVRFEARAEISLCRELIRRVARRLLP